MDDGYEDHSTKQMQKIIFQESPSCMDGLQNYSLMPQNEIFLKEKKRVIK